MSRPLTGEEDSRQELTVIKDRRGKHKKSPRSNRESRASNVKREEIVKRCVQVRTPVSLEETPPLPKPRLEMKKMKKNSHTGNPIR